MPIDPPHGPSPAPALIGAAHGTRSETGTETVRRLLDVMRDQRPGIPVIEAWVDVREPDVASVVSSTPGPAVVVPLLLSTGYHVRVDLPRAIGGRADVALAAPLGPDPALVGVLARRLREARAAAGGSADGGTAGGAAEDPSARVVLVSAGSSEPDAAVDVQRSAELLAADLGEPIQCAALSASPPLLDEVLASLDGGAVQIATYLLAEGFFAQRMEAAARAHGATVIAAPLGDDPAVAALAWRRYDEALAQAGRRAESAM